MKNSHLVLTPPSINLARNAFISNGFDACVNMLLKLCESQVEKLLAEKDVRIKELEAELIQRAETQVIVSDTDFGIVLNDLLGFAEATICPHEETHRGGTIWEICDGCGAKWADDMGGKPEFEWPAAIENAREVLRSIPPPITSEVSSNNFESSEILQAISKLSAQVKNQNVWQNEISKRMDFWNAVRADDPIKAIEKLESAIICRTRRETKTKIQQEIKESFSDPNKVHLNMLAGIIAKIPMESCAHIHGTETVQRWVHLKNFRIPSVGAAETLAARDTFIDDFFKCYKGFTDKSAARGAWNEALLFAQRKFESFLQGMPQ